MLYEIEIEMEMIKWEPEKGKVPEEAGWFWFKKFQDPKLTIEYFYADGKDDKNRWTCYTHFLRIEIPTIPIEN